MADQMIWYPRVNDQQSIYHDQSEEVGSWNYQDKRIKAYLLLLMLDVHLKILKKELALIKSIIWTYLFDWCQYIAPI